MTPEQFERAIEFILQQQAAFIEADSALSKRMDALSETMRDVAAMTLKLADLGLDHEERMRELRESNARLDRMIEIAQRRLDRLEGNSPN